ncbi:MAG TPA: tryptophan halogenase family protein [Cellvibrionaceae bacterium]
MKADAIQQIVIVGGGTAGWMTAAAVANHLPAGACQITLIESDAIGTVGVGESTIPHIRRFNEILGIDEAEFMAATNATYKLGICFDHWGREGDSYIHPFGEIGHVVHGIEFHHYWLKARQWGINQPLERYALNAVAARAGRFPEAITKNDNQFSGYAYAYHIDATAYAKFLRNYAEKKNVQRLEGKVIEVRQDSTENIESVVLESGVEVGGDLFIDCTGFRAELIEKTLGVEFIDWSHWLATDSAAVVPTERSGTIYPFTRASARKAGWQWCIPLQHRAGNGHVYASAQLSDDEAIDTLLNTLPDQPLAEPRLLRFKAGRRKMSWHKNCVAVGLSSGFLEPLESTSIYLIQFGIFKLLELFPDKQFRQADIDAYNTSLSSVYDTIRNFIILHYHLNQKNDLPFWKNCQKMAIPQELEALIALFSQAGRVDISQFGVWPAVCIGQHLLPEHYDTRLDTMNPEMIKQFVTRCGEDIQDETAKSSSVNDYLERFLTGASHDRE